MEPQMLHPAQASSIEIPMSNSLPCLLCDLTFASDEDDNLTKERILKHLLVKHKFVVSEVNLIADFKKYLEIWKSKFHDKAITDFCTVIKTNSAESDIEPSEFYYLLCDLLPEDKELRETLQKERLASVIEHQQREREDGTFSRICLFCKKHFQGHRGDLYTHMQVDHSFNIGHPDNIVFGNQLLDLLEKKLQNLQCLYCEKYFKSWDILKEHMRKKLHKRINPRNSAYDKFYLINYLEMGKNWQSLQVDDDRASVEPEQDLDSDWNDWQEENIGAVCLFCKYSSTDMESLSNHMLNEHSFALAELKTELNLNFYQQIKVINYIRKQVSVLKCVSCKQIFTSNPDLVNHMKLEKHFTSINKEDWDEPQYFFPTYENDTLLYMLEDGTDENSTLEGATVIPEDICTKPDSYLMDENVRRELR